MDTINKRRTADTHAHLNKLIRLGEAAFDCAMLYDSAESQERFSTSFAAWMW